MYIHTPWIFISGAYSNGLGVSSWDQMLADIVQGQNAQTGSCGDMCYVNVDGDNHLMERGESFHSPTDPCLKYTCQVSESYLAVRMDICC